MPIANGPHTSGPQTDPLADRSALRLWAILLVSTFVVYAVATVFHPGGVDPNNHPAVFAQYAQAPAGSAITWGGS